MAATLLGQHIVLEILLYIAEQTGDGLATYDDMALCEGQDLRLRSGLVFRVDWRAVNFPWDSLSLELAELIHHEDRYFRLSILGEQLIRQTNSEILCGLASLYGQ